MSAIIFNIEGIRSILEMVMLHDDATPRSPHEIAEQASEESNPDKIAELAEELIRSLDHQSRQRMKQVEDAKIRRKEAA
jgi:hypothetical protein